MMINPKSKNEYYQNSEEIIAMDLLCHFLNIPYNAVTQHESPDCIIEFEGRKIGVEITTLRPSSSLTKLLSGRKQGQNKNQIESVVRRICFECMKKHEIYDISIRFMLHRDLYFTSTSVRLKSHHNDSCIGRLSERLLLSSLVTLNMEWISLCLNRSGPIAFEIA